MKFDRDFRRKVVNLVMSGLALACVVIAIIPLGDILYTSVVNGAKVLSLQFLTSGPPLPCNPQVQAGCSYGGVSYAIQGTLLLFGLASLFAIPIGILAGVYLSEFGNNWFGKTARFLTDVLAGIPSIVLAIVVFGLAYFLTEDYVISSNYVISVLSASVALSFVMMPIVARTCEEALRSVPTATREAALALGLPRYRVVSRIVLSTGRSAVITGALLAVARAGGETAPLLILDPGSDFPFNSAEGLHQQSASLTFSIYQWVQSPYPNWHADAWGATLILVIIMLAISIAARLALRSRYGGPGT